MIKKVRTIKYINKRFTNKKKRKENVQKQTNKTFVIKGFIEPYMIDLQ